MLQVKSFSPKVVGDMEAMNEFLKTHIRPQDADILTVGDHLVISYEDGMGPSVGQKIVFKEQLRTKEEYKLRDYEHTQRLAEVKLNGIEKEIDKQEQILEDAEQKKSGLVSPNKKDKKEYGDYLDLVQDLNLAIKIVKKEIDRLNFIAENQQGIIKGQQAQITDSMIEIAVLDEEIANLKEGLNE